MIRYDVSETDLRKLIEAESSGWLKLTRARTAKFKKAKKYSEKSPIWSKVKAAYMKLQGDSKCAYCERKLESAAYGKGEQDVEHFRPKGNVAEWKAPSSLANEGIKFTRVPAKKGGYYALPYHPFNYCASCGPCNQALKKDYFPIAGRYARAGAHPAKLKAEKPYLLYPIGDIDDDPEDLITFHGLSPQAKKSSGFERQRALVTIEFFRLDDVNARKNLFKDRAMIIIALHSLLEGRANASTQAARAVADQRIQGFLRSDTPHSNCARSFARLHGADRAEANEIADSAVRLISGSS